MENRIADFSGYVRASRRRPIRIALLACLVGSGISTAHADDQPGYDRPGWGFSPQVVRDGGLILEQGLPDTARTPQYPGSDELYTADTLVRLGIGHQLELQLGQAAWNWLRASDGEGIHRHAGIGDSSVGLKLALPGNTRWNWGVLATVEWPDGASAFRAPQPQVTLGLQGNWQLDARQNLGFYLQDQRASGQDGQLAAISDNLSFGDWTPYAEAALIHNASSRGGAMAGAGIAWQATPRVQLDASYRHRLGGQADTWEAGLGVAIYFAH